MSTDNTREAKCTKKLNQSIARIKWNY